MDPTLWAGLKELEGATVETVRGKPFTVLAVDPGKQGAIVIELASTGKRRTILRDEIERAYGLGHHGEAVRPSTVRASGASERNPAYVAALLRALVVRL